MSLEDDLGKIEQRRDGYIDSLIARFERELNTIIAAAEAHTIADLSQQLKITDGVVERTPANGKLLRNLDGIFLEDLDRAGYQHLLDELVNQFPGQLPFFQEILDRLSQAMKTPLPKMQWDARSLKSLNDQALSAKDGLNAVMESIAARAKQRILLSVGGLKFKDLATSLAQYVHRALPEAVGLAETSTATFYRVISEKQYSIIEQDLPEMEIHYRYFGPYDLLIRPFCEHLLRVDKTYTRAQIDQMDNGQIPNVFVSCGGWRCRHQWLIAV